MSSFEERVRRVVRNEVDPDLDDIRSLFRDSEPEGADLTSTATLLQSIKDEVFNLQKRLDDLLKKRRPSSQVPDENEDPTDFGNPWQPQDNTDNSSPDPDSLREWFKGLREMPDSPVPKPVPSLPPGVPATPIPLPTPSPVLPLPMKLMGFGLSESLYGIHHIAALITSMKGKVVDRGTVLVLQRMIEELHVTFTSCCGEMHTLMAGAGESLERIENNFILLEEGCTKLQHQVGTVVNWTSTADDELHEVLSTVNELRSQVNGGALPQTAGNALQTLNLARSTYVDTHWIRRYLQREMEDTSGLSLLR